MNKKIFKRVWTLILVLSIVVTSVKLEAFAYSDSKSKDAVQEVKEEPTEVLTDDVANYETEETETETNHNKKKPSVVKELKKLRTADSSTYLLSNGSKRLEISGQKIHYKKNGKYEKYNPNLRLVTDEDIKEICDNADATDIENDIEKYAYVNAGGDSRQYFPKEFTENTGIIMHKNNYNIEFMPRSLKEDSGIKDMPRNKVRVKKDIVKEDTVIYTDEGKNTDYKYTSYVSGVKEDIVLHKEPESNIFEFEMNLQGMKLEKVEGSKAVQIIDKHTKEIVAYINEPNIKDGNGRLTYEEVDYEIENTGKGKYIFKIVVDKEYFKSPDIKYPVIIDPYVAWMDNALESATLSSNMSTMTTNFKNGAYFQVQNKAITNPPYTGVEYCCYIDTDVNPFVGTTEQFYGSRIESATLKIVEYNAGTSTPSKPGTIEIRTPEDTWSPNTITWYNHPAMGDKVWAQFTTTGTAGKGHHIDLKEWTQAVANREIKNYGLALKAKELGTRAYFYGSSLQNLNYMQLAIEYKETHAGIKDIYDYESFDTPNGSGSIEKSQGNFVYTQDDMALPTPQLGLGISRVYNSNSNVYTGFGYGWSCQYDARLDFENKGNTIIYRDETRALYEFIKGEDGIYTCAETQDMYIESISGKITKTTAQNSPQQFDIENPYILTNKNNIKYYFHSNGKLALIEEANGTFIYFIYDGELIKTIHSSKGQEIAISKKTVSGRNVYDQVQLADGSSFKYDYTGTVLTKVTHSDGKGKELVYNYEYNDNNKLVKIVDAEGYPYQLQYDGEQIISARYPDGEKIEITYGDMASTFTSKSGAGVLQYSEDYEFDDKGKLIYYKDASGNISTYEYTGTLLTKVKNVVEYRKIENGVVKTYSKELNENTKYNAAGNVTEETDEEGNVTVYEYAGTGINANLPTLIETTDRNGDTVSKTAFIYDGKGNIKKETDYITGTVTTYNYDNDGNVTQTKEILADENINLETANVPDGLELLEEEKTYDNDGNVTESGLNTGSIEVSEKNTCDKVGRLIGTEDNKNDRSIVYELDGFGRVIKTTQIIGGNSEVTLNDYNANGLVISETDRMGRVTTYEYDSRGRCIKQKLSYAGETRLTTTTYSYENISIYTGTGINESISGARVEIVKNASGEVTGKTYYNRKGQIVRELSNGVYIDYTYDKQGNVFTTFFGGTNEQDTSLGKLTVSIYDMNGRLTDTVINPVYKNGAFTVDETQSIVTSNVYDNTGNLAQTIDGNGNKTTYTYDESGRLTKVSLDDKSGTPNDTLYAYDIQNKNAAGDVVSTTDRTTNALGAVSETEMNGAGQVMSVTDKSTAGNIKTTYTYDINGNQTKEILSDGSYIEYEYNLKNLLLAKKEYTKDNICVKKTGYNYNNEDMLAESVDYNVSENIETPYRYTEYRYDSLNRMTGYAEIDTNTQPSEATINYYKSTYVYDIDDKLIKILYPKSVNDQLKGITFEYNSFKWLIGISGIIKQNGIEYIRKIRGYEYYNDSKLKTIKDYRGFLKGTAEYIQKTYEYDTFDRVKKMLYSDSSDLNTILEQYEYSYDKNDNILTERIISNYASNPEGRTDEFRTYYYNSLNRLLYSYRYNNLTGKSSSTEYTYDKVGNCTQIVENGITTINTYNELNQLTNTTVKKDDTYLGRISSSSFYYDSKGNQTGKSNIYSNSSTSPSTWNTYDINNKLTKCMLAYNDGTSVSQVNTYDNTGQRISKSDNGVITYYYYEGGTLLYTTNAGGYKTSQNILGLDGNIIATIRYDSGNQRAYFYNKDIRTSTTNIIDDSGNSVISYQYDDYGETQKFGNVSFYNEICYTGGIYDEFTGLYYLNARYYNPESMRFMSQDSYRGKQDSADTWNLYTYCAGNPITYVDPSGHNAIAVPLFTYGVANIWNPSGWIAIGSAVIIVAGTMCAMQVVYDNRYELSASINNLRTGTQSDSKSKSNKKTKSKRSLKSKSLNQNNIRTSKSFKIKGKSGRIDVEVNSSPPIHYHAPNGIKYYYGANGQFLTETGVKITKTIKKIMASEEFKKTLNKAKEFFNKVK